MPKITNQLDGWLIIDKPYNMGSTTVVNKLKRFLHPYKIGHAGTLDPLATGVLPIALGQATKTIPYVMDGSKTYQFEVTWGTETNTDDSEGEVTFSSDKRPQKTEIEKLLPHFTGIIQQTPPIYSALKINGKRAYELARRGETVELKPRAVTIYALKILNHTLQKTVFEVECGKGTYVRSLGHDLGRCLDCYGHISMLRRIKCGPFLLNHSILLENFEKEVYDVSTLSLIPVLTALDDILVLAVDKEQAKALMQGKALKAFHFESQLRAVQKGSILTIKYHDQLIALARYEDSLIKPFRVFARNI